MAEVGVRGLALQLLFTGSMGWLMQYLLIALNKREIAGMVKIVTVVLCVIIGIEIVNQIVQTVVNFLQPLHDFLNRWG